MTPRSLLLSTALVATLWQAAAMMVNASVLPGPGAAAAALAKELPRGLGEHFLGERLPAVSSMGLPPLPACSSGPGRRPEPPPQPDHFPHGAPHIPGTQDRLPAHHNAVPGDG